MYGYLNSFRVFLEAAGMFCAPWLVNRIGAKNGLIFAGMVMALRMVASGLVEGPLLISITKLLHAVELPVLLVAIFKYNSLNFDKRLSSTLYPGGLCLHQLGDCHGVVAAGGLQLREIRLRPVLSDYGTAGVLHHLYLHFLVAIQSLIFGSDDVATLRYLNEKSEEYDVHRC